MRKDTSSLKAYDSVLRGREYLSRVTRAETIKAQQMFENAIEIDSRYAAAHVGLGRSHLNLFLNGWTGFSDRAGYSGGPHWSFVEQAIPRITPLRKNRPRRTGWKT